MHLLFLFLLLLRVATSQNSTAPQKVPASAVLETIFKDYDPQVRPPNKHRNGSNKAIEVQVDTYIRSLSSIDFVKMEYSVQLTFRQSWIDRRLAYHHLGQRVPKFIILTRANQLWIPDTFFMNEKNAHKHLVDVPNILFRVHPDGRILYSERISLILSCPMFLQRFPMDRQMCEMKLASYAFTTDDIQYRWKYHDPLQFNVVLNWSIPNFELDNAYVGTCDSLTNTGLYSCLVATFHFSRQFSYYLVQIYVPSTLLVVVSWVSFWLERTAVPARVTLGVTTLLTITTQTTSLNAQLPAVSYVKAVDIWMGGCLVFIFGAVFEYAYVSLVASNLEITKKKYKTQGISDEKTNGKIDEEQTTAQDRANRKSLCGWWKHWTFQADESKMIDLYSRIFFPFGFLLFNIFYWFWYMGL